MKIKNNPINHGCSLWRMEFYFYTHLLNKRIKWRKDSLQRIGKGWIKTE